jgi:hypoxanthine phosphoribosyltransferase
LEAELLTSNEGGLVAESQQPEVLIPKDEIEKQVRRLAREISNDFQGKYPLMLGILKGSFVFLSDLIRMLDIPVEVDFVRLASYGSGKVTSGKVRMVQGLQSTIKDRDVIIVDDIVDTGLATTYLIEHLRRKKPTSVKVCALLDKPSRRVVTVPIDYRGIVVPDKFVVGYGLDYDERFRDLSDICVVED